MGDGMGDPVLEQPWKGGAIWRQAVLMVYSFTLFRTQTTKVTSGLNDVVSRGLLVSLRPAHQLHVNLMEPCP